MLILDNSLASLRAVVYGFAPCLPVAVVARSALAPFDCSHVGAKLVMDAEPSIVCGTDRGPHGRLRLVATVNMVLFVVGLPVSFALLLWRHRVGMREDQVLRQRCEGDTALSNPHYLLRQRYSALYMEFRPKMFYWKAVLLARKLLFAAIAVLTNQRVMLQVCTTFPGVVVLSVDPPRRVQ